MEIFTLLEELEDILENCKTVPFSGKSVVDKEEILEILKEIRLKLPDELKQAKWIKEERQRILVEAQKEADFVVRTIQNEAVRIASSIFAVYYDLEDWEIHSTGENSYGISQDTYGEMITTFVSTIENNLGVRGRVYASKNYIETRFPSYARDYATWVAQWNDTITYKGNYEGWQYSSTGSVPGINGNVDMNIFYY